jgi:curli biogenesis system outer membrane secretion channel CsgG
MSKVLCSLAIVVSLTPLAQAQRKHRVAVMNFDYATVQSSVQAIFGNNQDIGKGIADLLVNQLVKDGTYSVIERKALDKVLAEQNFSNSNRADPNSAARIGRVLGVDAIIIGSITQFGRDDKNTKLGGGGFGGWGSKYGLGGVGHHSAKAVVGISARMINTDTGEILAVADGHGQSSRSGTDLLGAGGSGGSGGGGGIDMSSSNFANTIIGEAVSQAVDDMARQLDQQAAKLPEKTVHIDGLIAYVNGGSVVLNIGSRDGVQVGERLKVVRQGQVIRDPATGRVLRSIETPVGEVVVTDVDAHSAGAKFTGGGVKVGDHVKND